MLVVSFINFNSPQKCFFAVWLSVVECESGV
jgi:hypothetical protein